MNKNRRKKPDYLNVFRNTQEVDQALLEIATLELQMEAIGAAADMEIRNITQVAAEEIEPLKNRVANLEAAVEAFAVLNREEILPRGRKSLELNHGVLGFRKSSKVQVKKSTLEKLEELGLDAAIRIKKTVDREELKTWSPEKLALVDASLKVSDDFWYETKRADVAEHTPHKQNRSSVA